MHRWSALVFALPLLVVFVTGFLLALEPATVVSSMAPHSVDAAKLEAIVAKHDPEGKADRIVLQPYSRALVVGNRGVAIDVDTGEPSATPSAVLSFFQVVRNIHEKLLLEKVGELVVVISTFGLLALFVLGVFLGPRPMRNTLSGWHTGTAWVALPLILVAPVTGLMMYYKVTFAAADPGMHATTNVTSMSEALRIVGRDRDLSTLLSLRLRKGVAEARLLDGGEYRTYTVTAEGLAPRPRNWPKLLHEGNWAGLWSAAASALVALALMTLLGTGVFIWGRRKAKRRRILAERALA